VKNLDFLGKQHYLYYNIQNEDGTLDYYAQINLYEYFTTQNIGRKLKYTESDSTYFIYISKDATFNNKILNVFLNGYFESYKIEETEFRSSKPMLYTIHRQTVDVKNQKASQWGNKAKHFLTGYIAYSMFIPRSSDPLSCNATSEFNYAKTHAFDIGIRYKYNVCKWYAIGGNFEYGITKFHIQDNRRYIRAPEIGLKYDKFVENKFRLEFFQRFRLATTSFGQVYFDLGIFGDATVSRKQKTLSKDKRTGKTYKITSPARLTNQIFDYGAKVRLGYGFVAIFAQYNDYLYFDNRINVGIELSIPY
jgi:hypothetical protein